MVTFSGRSLNTMDSKGRLALPAKFRKLFPKNFPNTIILTRSFVKCIYGYTVDEWENLLREIDELDLSETDKDDLSRFFLGNMAEVNLDPQGRMLVPQHLIEHAELQGEALVAGVGNRIEVWKPELFNLQIRGTEERVREILSMNSFRQRKQDHERHKASESDDPQR